MAVTTQNKQIHEIKQGDAGYLSVSLKLNGETVTEEHLPLFHCIEFMIGDGIRKVWPQEAFFADGAFRVPYTQEETFALEEGDKISVDVRVHFATNNDLDQVMGIHTFPKLKVIDAISEEILDASEGGYVQYPDWDEEVF